MAPSKTTRSGLPTATGFPTDSNTAVSQKSFWRLDTIPGKGKALVATQEIAPGTLILSEPPLLTTDCITSEDTIEKDLAAALKQLPKESQRAYLSLHNNFPGQKNPITNIVRSNAYPLGPGALIGGVFPNISRLNHSCRPNCKHSWNSKIEKEVVYTLRTISEGEELTLSYLPGGTSEERQDNLKDDFGFDCKCELCSLPSTQLRASDARILRAIHLCETIEDIDSQVKCPTKLIRNGLKLMKLYEEEGIKDDRLGNLYWEMFKIANQHRDQARASAFAQKYSDSKLMCEGPQSVNVQDMVILIKDPSKDSSFRRALKRKAAMERSGESLEGFEDTEGWSSMAADKPSSIDAEAFEKWLWRQ